LTRSEAVAAFRYRSIKLSWRFHKLAPDMAYQPDNLSWKKLLKKKLTVNDILVIAVNLVPLIGVWLWNWNAKEMFLVYCLESVIVGFYTVLQMLLTTFLRQRNPPDGQAATKNPAFIILFFILHYGLFVFIQMGIFLDVMNIPGLEGFGSVFTFLFHFPGYLSSDAMMVLLIFIFSYGVMITRKYFWPGTYQTDRLEIMMFTPYPRIFVQQFVVILGSFVMLFGAGATKVFMLIFVLVKIFFELVIDYDRLMAEAGKQPPDTLQNI
jgi:hypothetical protein